jgi:hypothetical protein
MAHQLPDSYRGESISSGTLLTSEILQACMDLLEEWDPKGAERLRDRHPEILCGDSLYGEADRLNSGDLAEEASSLLNEEVWDAMQGIAPEGTAFGASEGDGADFGFWEDQSLG